MAGRKLYTDEEAKQRKLISQKRYRDNEREKLLLFRKENPDIPVPLAGRERLTNKIVDERLEERTIKRVSEITRSKDKHKFECLVCGYVWSATLSSVLSGNGCRKCAKQIAPTNESLDEYLFDKTIIRIGEIKRSPNKTKFKCLVCEYEWDTVAYCILHDICGCPKCAGNEKITNSSLDVKLVGRNILRIGDVVNGTIKIDFQCLVEGCNHVWLAGPSAILFGYGCPMCKKKNEKRILEHLKEVYGKKNVKHHHNIYDNDRRYELDFMVNGVFIEYQGIQHYEPVELWGGKESFIKQVKRDYQVREYCRERHIKLIEIPYWFRHEEQYKLLEGLL